MDLVFLPEDDGHSFAQKIPYVRRNSLFLLYCVVYMLRK
jgi:hypothetical protein